MTALIHSMGAAVGSEDQLTGRSAENPLGFFERRDVRGICDALLAAAGGDWWKVDAFDHTLIAETTLNTELAKLAKSIASLDQHKPWAIKEPRISLLVPAFRKAIDEAVFVHVVRHPIEVARSLRRRNGFPLRAGIALWEAYNSAIVSRLGPDQRIIVDYNALMADAAAGANRLAEQLAAAGIVGLNGTDGGSIATDLYRERVANGEFDGLLTNDQKEFWDGVLSGSKATARHQRSAESRRTLREFEEDHAAALALRKRYSNLQAEHQNAISSETSDRDERLVAEIRAAIADREAISERAERRQKDLETKLAHAREAAATAEQSAAAARLEARERTAELQRAHDATEAARQEIDAELMRVRTESERLKRRLVNREARIADVGRLAAERDSQWQTLVAKRDTLINRLRRRLEKEALAADRLQSAGRSVADDLERVLTSRTWRLASRVARLRGAPASHKSAAGNRAAADIRTVADARIARYNKEPADADLDSGRDLLRFAPPLKPGSRSLGAIAFFTAIAGDYDPVAEPSIIDPAADYVLFTDDRDLTSSAWTTRAFDFVHAEPARTARFVKTHPHIYFPDHDRVIWIDANLQIDCLPEELISAENEQFDIITWQHPIRDCVYEELAECILRDKDEPAVMQEHIEALREAGYPEHNGLIESSVMLVRHQRPEVIAFLNDWWRLIDNGSKRDQLSFNPALSRHPGVTLGFLGEKGVEMRSDPRRHHPSYVPLTSEQRNAAE